MRCTPAPGESGNDTGTRKRYKDSSRHTKHNCIQGFSQEQRTIALVLQHLFLSLSRSLTCLPCHSGKVLPRKIFPLLFLLGRTSHPVPFCLRTRSVSSLPPREGPTPSSHKLHADHRVSSTTQRASASLCCNKQLIDCKHITLVMRNTHGCPDTTGTRQPNPLMNQVLSSVTVGNRQCGQCGPQLKQVHAGAVETRQMCLIVLGTRPTKITRFNGELDAANTALALHRCR